MIPTLTTSIQHSSGSPFSNNEEKEIRQLNWKRGS